MAACARLLLWLLFTTKIAADTSVPVGQHPAIAYRPNPQSPADTFLVYQSMQGLQSMCCKNSDCTGNPTQNHLLKCDANLYSSAVLAVNYTGRSDQFSSCQKTITVKGQEITKHCTYFIVLGFTSLSSKSSTGTNSVELIICYDITCDPQYIDTQVIETSFDTEHFFGYSISLSTWLQTDGDGAGQRYPMFTYGKFRADLNQYVLNTIICTSSKCTTWIGKDESYSASTPPYILLGPPVSDSNSHPVGKAKVSIQETWFSAQNYVSVMFPRLVNISNNYTKTDRHNVYVLGVAMCALKTSGNACNTFDSGTELNSIIIFHNDTENESKQILKTNHVSMVQYEPSADSEKNAPLFIAAYVISNSANKQQSDELWLLYCFSPTCPPRNRTLYSVHSATSIEYAQITSPLFHSQKGYFPKLFFFQNSTSLMQIRCNLPSASWNCTSDDENHEKSILYQDANFQTDHMQIAVTEYPQNADAVAVLFSQVMQKDKTGAGVFNGTMYSVNGDPNFGPNLLPGSNALSTQNFSTSFNYQVFIILSWVLTFIVVAGIVVIYKFVSPIPFISKNVRNAYLTKVTLDPSTIRPLSYWFFFANLICSSMCIIPWFIYFDSGYHSYIRMVIPPAIPINLTLLFVFVLHICSLQTKNLTPILIAMSLLYYVSLILLAYSFAYVWNVKSQSCLTSDLSGLKIVILTGHIATALCVLFLLFWNVKCFRAIRYASPERNPKKNPLLGPQEKDTMINRKSNQHRIIPSNRLLDALQDRQQSPP